MEDPAKVAIVSMIIIPVIVVVSLIFSPSSTKYDKCLEGVELLANADKPAAIKICNKYLDGLDDK